VQSQNPQLTRKRRASPPRLPTGRLHRNDDVAEIVGFVGKVPIASRKGQDIGGPVESPESAIEIPHALIPHQHQGCGGSRRRDLSCHPSEEKTEGTTVDLHPTLEILEE
jgi:hypothetical protein